MYATSLSCGCATIGKPKSDGTPFGDVLPAVAAVVRAVEPPWFCR
jgi:hypothetical protein